MPTPVLRLATLLIGLSGPPGTVADLPADGEVKADAVAAYLEPDAASIAPERLGKGEKIRVVEVDPVSGWLTIEPPASAFDWIERTAVRRDSATAGQVVAPSTLLRVGIHGARMPGPPKWPLSRGATVQFLDRPALILGTGERATTWLAVASSPGEFRYVRSEGIAWRRPALEETPREVRTAFEEAKTTDDKPLPLEIAEIETEHRAILSGRVEGWQLAPVRARYESLLKRVSTPEVVEAIRARLDLVARHEAIARSARGFQTALDRSRRLDQNVAMTLSRLARRDAPSRRPFIAEGLIQVSSRLVEGRRVYALIGADGEPVAYLDVPPGLDARFAESKRVGVRGTAHFNVDLGTRLIAVKDLEPLE